MFARLLLGLLLSNLALVLAQENDDDSFAAFKLNGVETDCLVTRLAKSGFWGDGSVGKNEAQHLSDAEAKAAHECALPLMIAAYRKSTIPAASNYANWPQFSTSPYSSATHGNRYVNNYASPIAAARYRHYEQAGSLPVGSILVKDSFVVNNNGRVVFGALSIMEKMPSGFNPEGGDWRYTLILPDGRLFGRTKGESSFAVKFCQDCHSVTQQSQDSLFFVPEAYRVR